MIPPLLFIAVAALCYALVSKRLETTIVTAPLLFAGLGLLAGPALGLVDIAPDSELLLILIEAALIMVLFADASSLDMREFRGELTVSKRLLGVGLPLTIVAGAVVAAFLVPGIAVWQAAPDAVLLTVALSIVAHGVTAAWGARRYASWFERTFPVTPGMPEAAELATPSRYPRETASP